MYFCIGCGSIFSEPVVVSDGHGFAFPPFEVYELCPHCGSSNIEKSYEEEKADELSNRFGI